MKKLLLFALLCVTGFAKAQAPTYDDLRILYADGNFEKLVRNAEGYTQKDNSKGDPLPWMWLGRGLYKISISSEADEKYKNAYKDAIGALGKSIKLDKDLAVQTEYAEFYNEFKSTLVETIMNETERKDYKKASSWVLKYFKLDPNSIGAKYMDGVCKFRNSDKGGANTAWKDAETRLGKVTGIESWTQADKDLLKLGVLQTAECLVSVKQTEKAKTLLGKVAQWFENDEDFKAKYDAIVNK